MSSKLANIKNRQPAPNHTIQDSKFSPSDKVAQLKAAYKEVLKAEKAFHEVDSHVETVLQKRSAFVLGESVYRGLFEDYLVYGAHSISDISFSSEELSNIVTVIIANNDHAGLIATANNKITEYMSKGTIPGLSLITQLSEAFLPPFATFFDPKNTPAAFSSTKIADAADIAKGVITSNTNLKAVVARASVFYAIFEQVQAEYKYSVGFNKSPNKSTANLKDKLTDLQNAIRNYNLFTNDPLLIPGLISATGGKSAYYSILKEYQIANANRLNIVNTADANILMREITQQVVQQLKNISNPLQAITDMADIDLHGLITEASMRLIDNYRMIKGGKTMAEKNGSLLNATRKGYKLNLSLQTINKHISSLSNMLKVLSDEGSKNLIALQDATFKKNNASEELSKLIRRFFSALDAAFGLSSD